MSRRPSNSAAAVTRRQRKRLRAELDRVSEIAARRLQEAIAEGLFDAPMPGAERGPVLEARVEGHRVVIDPPPVPSRRRRRE
jgi:hypothetical protein